MTAVSADVAETPPKAATGYVNEKGQALQFKMFQLRGPMSETAHARAFWGATVSFFVAFFGWFSLAPLGLEVASSMGVCENQLYPPEEIPTRPAFLRYIDHESSAAYCRYGTLSNDDETLSDCVDAPHGSEHAKYDFDTLPDCVCTAATYCSTIISYGNIASVSSTIIARLGMGRLLEKFGPVNMQCALLLHGAFWIALSSAILSPWAYVTIRFFIGTVGATFVTNQFWTSLMFAPRIVGVANATAAGWGNLGGAVAQAFMLAVLLSGFRAAGLSSDVAWRLSMAFPFILFVGSAVMLKLMCWDTPTKRRLEASDLGKSKESNFQDELRTALDPRVLVLALQYSACFGAELTMNSMLAMHFRTYHQFSASAASWLAFSFGFMNLFARSLGGLLSDIAFAQFRVRGRLWTQCVCLVLEAVFLFLFGTIDASESWLKALALLICFSIFVQMAEGSTYAIIPCIGFRNLATVSAVVGAGGNAGAVIAIYAFYGTIHDQMLAFKVHAAYVMVFALATPFLHWPEHGSMFLAPKADVDGSCS